MTVAMALNQPLGRWFNAPNLGRYLPLFIVSMLIERVIFVPERLLVRELRFGWLAVARAGGELAYTAVSVALAAHGVGAMAIAWGNLARSTFRFLTIVPSVNRREWLEPHRLRLATMTKIVSYGIEVSVATIATFAMRRWDNMIVSRYYGPAVMGAYNYAYNLADTPAVAIGEQMSDVISASLPHASADNRVTALVRASTMISLIMFPLGFGLGAVAPTVVQTFFTQRWASVGTMLVFLSVLSAPRPIAHILIAYFFACQRPRVVVWLEWFSLGAIVVTLSTIGRLGTTWACAAVGMVCVLRTLAAMWAVQRMSGVRMAAFLVPLARPLVASAVMVAAILLVRPELDVLRPAAQLVVEVLLGAVVYVAAALVIAGSASREFFGLIRSAMSR